MNILVAVTDRNATHLYGPFPTFAAAHEWAGSMKNSFHGRIVHIIRKEPIAVG